MTTDRPMQLGMVGLGRMGANLSRRLMRDGHRVVAYDHTESHVKQLADEGATGATTLRGVRRQAGEAAGGLGHAARLGHRAGRRATG